MEECDDIQIKKRDWMRMRKMDDGYNLLCFVFGWGMMI
jgi:hypothetical protein